VINMRTILAVLGLGLAAHSVAAQSDYRRAEQFLTWNTLRYVYHDHVSPEWYRDSTRFWYRVHTREGFEFLSVVPATGVKTRLFDNARLAASLSVAADTALDPGKLPFQTFVFDQDGKDERAIVVRFGKRAFRCELASYQCVARDTLPDRTRLVRSPDDRWDAFVSGYNLWVRTVGSTDSVQLTKDGIEGYSYGTGAPRPGQLRLHLPSRPTVVWSPDSKRLAVVRLDERKVEKIDLISMTSTRPVHYSFPYALPGDSIVEMQEWYLADLEKREARRADAPPQPAMSFYTFGSNGLQWSPASDRVFFTQVDRGPKHVRLFVADPSTGSTRQVLADSSAAYVIGTVDLALTGSPTNWRILKNGDLIWLSERDGFAHLYRYGPDGTLKNQVTSGAWVVSGVAGVDETLGRVYLTGKGREPDRHPDYLALYSVNLDGSGLTLLSPEKSHHLITPVPSGRWFLDTYSTISEPPVSVIRGADGHVVAALEKADITDLLAIGWKPGQVFMARARDGVTPIWGVIWKPSTFDSTRKYPVIDHIYPGPLISPAVKYFFPAREPINYPMFGQVQALAELGFVVVSIDAIGNTGRAKALNTLWYGNMGDNGIPDHVAAIEELASRMPQLDLDRVGIYGHSGGGFASTDALLRYPDFYKVAVSTSGNHDNRTYYSGWGERFQGLLVRDTLRKTDNYAAAANKTYASALKGKLFLIHGDMDDNVHPAHTIALVDALIKANKSFDFLIVPDADHQLTHNPYVIRRTWDYFVRNLQGREPPADYGITPAQP
jgi:dipeptidyl aminopeptidase/acylaminoacyl peptidase